MNKKKAIPKYLNNNFPNYTTQSIYIAKTCVNTFDYNNPEEKHPQPHWHITSSQAIEKTLKEYANDFGEYDFISLLEQEKEETIDVKRIHFAMNGSWHNNGYHTHKIDNEQQIVKWLQGLLSHLRTELEK